MLIDVKRGSYIDISRIDIVDDDRDSYVRWVSDDVLDAVVEGTLIYRMNSTGVAFPDNIKVTFGTGNDATIYYDGTHLKIQPRDVGSGNLHVNDDCLVWIGTTGRASDSTFTTTDATVGLVVHNASNATGSLIFKNSGVAHGMTDQAETDTFSKLGMLNSTAGGLQIVGLREASSVGNAVEISGILGSNSHDTGKLASDRAAVGIWAAQAGTNDITANGNILMVSTWQSGAVLFVDREGDVHANGQFVAGLGDGETTARTGTTVRAPNVAAGGAGNIAGADLTIAAGLGTGTGDEGTIIFQLPILAAAGDNLQTIATRLTLDMAGSTTQVTMTVAQDMMIQRASTAGVAAAFLFDIPIAAGGAADAVVKHEFQLDGTARAGAFTETDGAGGDDTTVTIWRVPYRDSGVNVAAPGSPAAGNNATWNGGLRIEAGDDTNRIYFFANEAWHYINQTAGLSFTAEEREMYGHRWEVGDLGLVIIDRHFGDGAPHGLLYPADRWLNDTLPGIPAFSTLEDRVEALEEANQILREQLTAAGIPLEA